MTELEIMQRAKRYMDNLANGIDPLTGQELPEDSVLNNVRLSRCFFYVSGVLGQVIDNGGTVGAKKRPHRQPFSLTAEQYARITPAEIPLTITQVVALCNAEIDPEAHETIDQHPADSVDAGEWDLADGRAGQRAQPPDADRTRARPRLDRGGAYEPARRLCGRAVRSKCPTVPDR